MAGKTVNPTRMELTRLKGRLKTASRGHKLLKDKRDEQMRQFMILVRRSRQLRAQVEQALAEAQGAFTVAAAVMSPEMLQQMQPAVSSVMATLVPWRKVASTFTSPYSFSTSTIFSSA